MLPPFDDNGYLPPGIHPATLEEIATRFGTESELRQAQMDSLRWMCDLAWKTGALRIVVNGSFVTDKYEPNDVDCVILIDQTYLDDADVDTVKKELRAGFPFVNMELSELKLFTEFVEEIFGKDRDMVPKGLVEVTRDD